MRFDPLGLAIDLFFFFLGLYILMKVLRWGIPLIFNEVRGFFEQTTPAPPRRRRRPAELTEGKVFHVGALDGRNQIVHAKDDEEASVVGARALGVRAEDVVVSEVYDKVVRK